MLVLILNQCQGIIVVDKIISWLGGISKEAHENQKRLWDSQIESYRNQYLNIKGQNELLTKTLDSETVERKYLQDLIFKKFGVTIMEQTEQRGLENLQPLRIVPRSARATLRDMEMDDKVRASTEKKA